MTIEITAVESAVMDALDEAKSPYDEGVVTKEFIDALDDAGYVIVPKELTADMLQAGRNGFKVRGVAVRLTDEALTNGYRALLAAHGEGRRCSQSAEILQQNAEAAKP